MEGSNKSPGFLDGNPKMIFVFGLVTGVAATVIFGGGINLPSFENSNTGGRDPIVINDDDSGNEAPSAAVVVPPSADEHVLGDLSKAKVVMIEYSDFECPFCERHHPTMQQAVDEFGDDVAWVFRHFPLSFHAEARPSALASECAAEQGKFWEFGDEMFENQSKLGDDFYSEVASDLGLDMTQFNDCYESEKYAAVVDADQASGTAAGVSGTPATFVNGVLVSGAIPYSTLKDAIEQELN